MVKSTDYGEGQLLETHHWKQFKVPKIISQESKCTAFRWLTLSKSPSQGKHTNCIELRGPVLVWAK